MVGETTHSHFASLRPWSLLLTAFVLCFSVAGSQTTFPADSTVSDSASAHGFWSRYNLSRMGAAGIVGGSLLYSAGVWWVNDFHSFHLDPSKWWETDMGVDKEGHVYTCYYMFRAINALLLWGGHDSSSAFWWSLAASGLYGPLIEVGDGFSQYGFDFNDVAADLAGVGFAALQVKVPYMQNFELKWSLYYPLNRHSFKINDLYDYHIYWISARVHNLLPSGARPYWPEWLQMAFGVGTWNHERRTYVLSLDYNLEKILPDGQDLNVVTKLLNMFHLPAPGVKFRKGAAPEWQLLLLH